MTPFRPPSSPSQRCKVYTQKGVMPASPSLSSHTLVQDAQPSDAITSDSKFKIIIYSHFSKKIRNVSVLPSYKSLFHHSPYILCWSHHDNYFARVCADSLAADSGRSSTESLLSRTSPAGMSPQIRDPTASLSASLGSAETLCDDDVPPIPLDTLKEGKGKHIKPTN